MVSDGASITFQGLETDVTTTLERLLKHDEVPENHIRSLGGWWIKVFRRVEVFSEFGELVPVLGEGFVSTISLTCFGLRMDH